MTLPKKFNNKEKWCNKCQKTLPLNDFNNNSTRPGGKEVFCRQCRNELQKQYLRQHRYGLSNEDYERIILEQDNKCAICKRNRRRLVVDHDHKNGKFRGIICDGCNIVLGHLDDDIGLLQNVIKYLKQSKLEKWPL